MLLGLVVDGLGGDLPVVGCQWRWSNGECDVNVWVIDVCIEWCGVGIRGGYVNGLMVVKWCQ